jgi:Cytochrome P460
MEPTSSKNLARRARRGGLVVAVAAVLGSGCSGAGAADPSLPGAGPRSAAASARPPAVEPPAGRAGGEAPAKADAEPDPELVPELAQRVRAVAEAYTAWGRVDESPKQAPTLCAAPPSPSEPPKARLSAAAGAHGKKLYFLWASGRDAYFNLASGEVPEGFAIVKQAFTTVTTQAAPRDRGRAVPLPGGWWLVADQPADLFVMIKVGAGHADPAVTDEGWIYGTVTPAGEVSSAGRVASCMGCHAQAKRDRLFGLAKR